MKKFKTVEETIDYIYNFLKNQKVNKIKKEKYLDSVTFSFEDFTYNIKVNGVGLGYDIKGNIMYSLKSINKINIDFHTDTYPSLHFMAGINDLESYINNIKTNNPYKYIKDIWNIIHSFKKDEKMYDFETGLQLIIDNIYEKN